MNVEDFLERYGWLIVLGIVIAEILAALLVLYVIVHFALKFW